MTLITIDTLAKFQKQNNAVYWKVLDRTKKLTLNQNDDNIDLDSSIDLLRDTLKNCIGDFCNVKLFTEKPTQLKEGSTKGKMFELQVQLDSPTSYRSNPGASINAPSFDTLIGLQKQVLELEYEKKLAEATADNERVKPIDKLVEKLTQGDTINLLIGAFMNKLNKTENTAASINGAADMAETLKRLSAVDPNYKHTLEKMTSYLEKNPGVLAQIKMIIGA
jgi:hypothetical protein